MYLRDMIAVVGPSEMDFDTEAMIKRIYRVDPIDSQAITGWLVLDNGVVMVTQDADPLKGDSQYFPVGWLDASCWPKPVEPKIESHYRQHKPNPYLASLDEMED